MVGKLGLHKNLMLSLQLLHVSSFALQIAGDSVCLCFIVFASGSRCISAIKVGRDKPSLFSREDVQYFLVFRL